MKLTPKHQNTTTTEANKIHQKWSIQIEGAAPVRFYVNGLLSLKGEFLKDPSERSHAFEYNLNIMLSPKESSQKNSLIGPIFLSAVFYFVLSPKGEFLKELTDGSHLFKCSLLLCLIHLVLETQIDIFCFR